MTGRRRGTTNATRYNRAVLRHLLQAAGRRPAELDEAIERDRQEAEKVKAANPGARGS